MIPPVRRFHLHINYMEEPRHRIWQVTLPGTRGHRQRVMYATRVVVSCWTYAIPGPRASQPRAFIQGHARYFQRLRDGAILISDEWRNTSWQNERTQGSSRSRAASRSGRASRRTAPARSSARRRGTRARPRSARIPA